MAMRTSTEWSEQLCRALAQIDPQMSTEVGDPVRKVIDATASVAASIDMNSQVNMSFFDLDSKVGTDLDALASWLGFGRRDGLAATGEARLYLDSPAKTDMQIPSGTQLSDGTMTYITTDSAAISQYDTECTVPIRCTSVGTAGNANAYTIDHVLSTWASNGLKCENKYDLRNGVDVETDAELRKRIRTTFLRNVAGTEDAYMGISNMVTATTKANVLGPIERWEEQLEVVELPESLGGGWGFQSMIPCSKYTWPRQTYLVREPDTENERQYVEGIDYTVDVTHGNPVVKVNNVAGELDLSSKSGAQLDAIGKAIGLPRYAGTPSTGSVSFAFDVAQGSNYTIAKGSIVTDASNNQYRTLANATIYSQSLASDAVPVESVLCKPLDVASGTKLTYMDGKSYKCMVSDRIYGGASAWDDAEYRTQITSKFSSMMDIHLGDFLFFKHEYCPLESRNEPAANPPMTNKVDVFIDGEDIQPIRECTQLKYQTITNDTHSRWNASDWYYEDGTHPTSGTKLVMLGYSPATSLPSSLNIDGAKYDKFQLCKRMDLLEGSTREWDAIAFQPGSNLPSEGSFLELKYYYNRAVLVTDQLLDTNRQITTDVLAHQCRKVGLDINVIVQNITGASDDALLADINSYLDVWCRSLDYGSWVQFSDIEYAIRNSKYVDACRIATNADVGRLITSGPGKGEPVQQGLQTTEAYRSMLPKQHNVGFRLHDNMLAYIHQVNVVREASNTYE